LGLTPRFAAICGADTFAFRKPDPRHLTETILKAGGDPSRAVMVGDSQTDIDTAKAAGIPVVAVDFGYTDLHVREYEPSAIISHFDELTIGLATGLIAAAAGR
jgi:phosphoglycolate phosphatase